MENSDILLNIFSFLNLKESDLLNLRLVSSNFKNVTEIKLSTYNYPYLKNESLYQKKYIYSKFKKNVIKIYNDSLKGIHDSNYTKNYKTIMKNIVKNIKNNKLKNDIMKNL